MDLEVVDIDNGVDPNKLDASEIDLLIDQSMPSLTSVFFRLMPGETMP